MCEGSSDESQDLICLSFPISYFRYQTSYFFSDIEGRICEKRFELKREMALDRNSWRRPIVWKTVQLVLNGDDDDDEVKIVYGLNRTKNIKQWDILCHQS